MVYKPVARSTEFFCLFAVDFSIFFKRYLIVFPRATILHIFKVISRISLLSEVIKKQHDKKKHFERVICVNEIFKANINLFMCW